MDPEAIVIICGVTLGVSMAASSLAGGNPLWGFLCPVGIIIAAITGQVEKLRDEQSKRHQELLDVLSGRRL